MKRREPSGLLQIAVLCRSSLVQLYFEEPFAMKPLLPLPTDISEFERLRDANHPSRYIDKTAYIHRLITQASYYFLSRPRRFGKSLLISTLKALFQGKKELFKGLAIAQTDYDFPGFPTIHLDGSSGRIKDQADFEDRLIEKLKEQAESNQVNLDYRNKTARKCFEDLIATLGKDRQVVVLIDEYDKPILDHIDDLPKATMIRDTLKDFYGVLKERQKYLRFVLLTGVSRFSKVSLFSGLNHLVDISTSKDYAAMLGITEEELQSDLEPYLQVMASEIDFSMGELKDNLKHWYNGYRFSVGKQQVYNPVSLMRALTERHFDNYWFQTGTPTMLIQQIKNDPSFDITSIGHYFFDSIAFETFEIEALDTLTLMIQTGYLTIADVKGKPQTSYRLDYPNFEVRHSLFTYLIESYSQLGQGHSNTPITMLTSAMSRADNQAFQKVLSESFMAQVPYDLHIPQEKYYQSMFHVLCTLLGMKIQAEVKTNIGRIDHVLITETQVFIIEMKYDKPVAEAMQQIEERGYDQAYRNLGKQILWVGISFFADRRIASDIRAVHY
jgi:hypothetical protein